MENFEVPEIGVRELEKRLDTVLSFSLPQGLSPMTGFVITFQMMGHSWVRHCLFCFEFVSMSSKGNLGFAITLTSLAMLPLPLIIA